MSTKRLAVVCNYVLRADRIGGMDRFFVAYDKAAKAKGYEVDWFFPDVLDKTFYEGVTLFSAEGNSSVEAFFLNYLQENEKTYTALVTHFFRNNQRFIGCVTKHFYSIRMCFEKINVEVAF